MDQLPPQVRRMTHPSELAEPVDPAQLFPPQTRLELVCIGWEKRVDVILAQIQYICYTDPIGSQLGQLEELTNGGKPQGTEYQQSLE